MDNNDRHPPPHPILVFSCIVGVLFIVAYGFPDLILWITG